MASSEGVVILIKFKQYVKLNKQSQKEGYVLYVGHYQKMEDYVSLLIFSHPQPPLCCFTVNNT